MNKPENPMVFENEPDINKICAALSRILSNKHDMDITVTAKLKSGEDDVA